MFCHKKKVLLFLFVLSFQILTGCKTDEESINKLDLSALDSYSEREFDKALFYLKGAGEIDKKNPQVIFLRAKIYFFQKDYEKCRNVLDTVIKNNPEFTEARIWRIRCEIVNKDYENAMRDLDNELKWNMTDWRVFYLYSLFSKNQEKFDEQLVMLKNAELCLQDASKVYAASATTWGMLGIETKEKGYIKKAQIIGGFGEGENNEN